MPRLGAPGGATGAIAIGMAAMSTSTTIIISIRTTILIATSIAKAATTGNTIHNTVATRHTATEGPRTSSAVRVRAEPGIAVVRAALAVPEDPVVRAALAVPEDPVVRAVLAVPEDPVVRAALAVPEDQVVRAVLAVPEDQVAPESQVAPANQAVPEDQVAPENQAAPAELVPVRGEAEPGPVQALGTDHPPGRLVVPQRTKSVTVAHHRVRAVVLAAGDLAAVVETTRERAAAEADAVWVAAG